MDTEHNDAIHDVGDYDMMKWKTNYYLLNGRIFTADLKNALSTIADPNSLIKAKEGETVLLRFLAMGFDHQFVFHPGVQFQVGMLAFEAFDVHKRPRPQTIHLHHEVVFQATFVMLIAAKAQRPLLEQEHVPIWKPSRHDIPPLETTSNRLVSIASVLRTRPRCKTVRASFTKCGFTK